jgi:hypothetical protein
MEETAKRPNAVARIDAVIADWQRLHQAADEIIDDYIAGLRQTHPACPGASLRSLAINSRVGSTLDIAAAMRLIRKTVVGESTTEEQT